MNNQTKAIFYKSTFFIFITLTQISAALGIGESKNTLLISRVRDTRPSIIQIPEHEHTYTGIRVEAVYKRNSQTNEIEINGAKVEAYSILVQNGQAIGELTTKKLFDLPKEKAVKIEALVKSPSLVQGNSRDLLSTDDTPASQERVVARLYYAKKPWSNDSFFIGHRSTDSKTYVIRNENEDQISEPAKALSQFLNYSSEIENLLK